MTELKSKVVTLKSVHKKLKTKLVEFLFTQRLVKKGTQEKSEHAVASEAAVPQPIVRLESTRLPEFPGAKRRTRKNSTAGGGNGRICRGKGSRPAQQR